MTDSINNQGGDPHKTSTDKWVPPPTSDASFSDPNIGNNAMMAWMAKMMENSMGKVQSQISAFIL